MSRRRTHHYYSRTYDPAASDDPTGYLELNLIVLNDAKTLIAKIMCHHEKTLKINF